MIKVATLKDYELIKSFVDELLKESFYGKFFGDYRLTPEMYERYVGDPSKKLVLIIGEDEGFSAFDLIPWMYNDAGVFYARMSYIYIKPESRKKGLMTAVHAAFDHWAKRVGAKYQTVGLKNKKKGYKKAEVVYVKEVNNA